MNRETELRLIEEALALKAKGETQYQEAPQTLSTERYRSQERFEKEIDKLFMNNIIALGIANEVPEVGDFREKTTVRGLSLIMVRDTEANVRVFANACRHRSAQLVAIGERGCKRKFSCPYHAWTYNTQGELVGAPDFERGFTTLNKASLGLREFDCRVVNGVVFIHLDPDQSLPDQIIPDEIASGFDYLKLAEQRVYKRRSYTVKANWKILTEGGIEAYHFNVAHRNTLAPYFLGNLSTWESWGGLSMRMILPKKPLMEAEKLSSDDWDLRKMANIIYSIAPSCLFLAQPDNISMIKMTPLSPNTTRIEEVLLVDPPQDGSEYWSEAELSVHETNYNLVYKILSEDWVLGETIQANMDSGVTQAVHFGRFESALSWFHCEYDRAINDDSLVIARSD